MKILLSFLLIFVFVLSSLASPHEFKIKNKVKEIKDLKFAEIGLFDTTKYASIRVGVDVANGNYDSNRLYIYGVERDDEVSPAFST